MTSRRVSRLLVAECRSRSTSSLIERVLLDVGVRLRDVGLGLVVVVVGDEVLDRVVGQELAELVGELGRQRLVRRQDQGGALQPLDQPGRGRGLAGAGRAEQDDVLLPRRDPPLQVVDRRGLVAGRLEVGDHLERRHGADELADRSHAPTVRRRADSVEATPHRAQPSGQLLQPERVDEPPPGRRGRWSCPRRSRRSPDGSRG